jgi:hypothetical protein
MTPVLTPSILIADEVWVGLALLHRAYPDRESFLTREILDRIRQEGAHPEMRSGVQPHISLHNVANLAPNPARYRLSYRLPDGTYRLYRPGDDYDPARTGKTHPDRADLPAKYHELLDWYLTTYCGDRPASVEEEDPFLRMSGVGRELWADIDADSYVDELREGWDELDLPTAPPDLPDAAEIWQRLSEHAGEVFHTVTGLPFTYTVFGSAIQPIRNGKSINQMIGRSDVEAAVRVLPLRKPSDIKMCRGPAYVFGMLTDPRILKA